ncbi:MarR family transcriptional regulator [Nitratireductor pacificus]|uniref:IclR family transcriptional regulator n=1 Tax=Nitratireductor pacificus pht-3B TaxID=391937 RepID=K2MNK9_9HYPH|nr:MarR family transcriptional regulator [Nitratireductor pacificus]EKF18872.1 IclR family transcriptional regulator [Nitratireductor pacificus pht-3B]
MRTSSDEGTSTVALQNGLELVRLLSAEGPMNVDELSDRAALKPETVAKLVNTLEMHGYIEPTRFADRFQPGRIAGALSESFLRGAPIGALARPVMQTFAETHGATVSLVVPEGDHALSLQVCRSLARDAAADYPGSSVAMERSAGGHALLFTASTQGRELAQLSGEETALSRSLAESFAFFRASGCFKVIDRERNAVMLGAPLHLSDAVLAVEALLPRPVLQGRSAMTVIRDLLEAVELIQRKSAAAGVRYLDD